MMPCIWTNWRTANSVPRLNSHLQALTVMSVESSIEDITGDNRAPLRFITRQQERNRKKKLQKKLAKQRRREKDNNNDFPQIPEVTSNGSSESSSQKEYPHFELAGPFERFKVLFLL